MLTLSRPVKFNKEKSYRPKSVEKTEVDKNRKFEFSENSLLDIEEEYSWITNESCILEKQKIMEKLEKYRNLSENWNGEKTYPPDSTSVDISTFIINRYENFISKNFFESSDIHICPLNSGGIGFELISEVNSLEIDIPNGLDNKDYYKNYISYLITDDIDFEEEDKVNLVSIEKIFSTLHYT